MNKKLVSDDSLKAYEIRSKKMNKEKDTAKGDELFIVKMAAISEQINNLHVKAKVNDYEIECDGPKDLGGSGKIPGPMPMLLASFANCLEITALLYLSYMNIKVDSIKVKVEAEYDQRSALKPKKEPFPGFFNLTITWNLKTEENFKKIERILNKVEEVCPVKGTISKIHIIHQKIELNN
ncbi:MAG: OsmC family protein [Promethearchaeota archaeon]